MVEMENFVLCVFDHNKKTKRKKIHNIMITPKTDII